jgi:photosystem II stability/assembly factor-like uncharacterized protein
MLRPARVRLRNRATLACCIALGGLVTDPPAARANGRFPAANALVLAPDDPERVVLRATFGILLSRDRGTTFDWLCETAIGLPASSIEDPSIAVTATGTLVAGTSGGLSVSTDDGCDWLGPPGIPAPAAVRDLVVRPNTPDQVLALASSYVSGVAPDGGAGYASRVFASDDDGAQWAAIGAPLDPSAVVTTLEVAPSDPSRLYVSLYRGQGTTRAAWLAVSTDAGATWAERPVPLDNSVESAAFIGAVDPTNPDRVYVRTQGRSRLLVTADAGRTYSVGLSFAGPMLGFALSPDGATAYAGGPEDGLHVARPAQTAAFARVSGVHVQCLAAGRGELWACADEASGFAVGLSTDDGTTFTPKLHLDGVSGPVACAPTATAAMCAGSAFEQLCQTLACTAGTVSEPIVYDGGNPPKPIEAGTPTVPVRVTTNSCACSPVVGATPAALVAALPGGLVAAAALVLRLRGRRSRRAGDRRRRRGRRG